MAFPGGKDKGFSPTGEKAGLMCGETWSQRPFCDESFTFGTVSERIGDESAGTSNSGFVLHKM
jgi:hypothetical protein